MNRTTTKDTSHIKVSGDKKLMVSLALPILSTKNMPKTPSCEFCVVDSGQTRFPNDENMTTYLDVIDSVKGTKYRFGLNWTNEKILSGAGYLDTEDLHTKNIVVTVVKTQFKSKATEGLRISNIDGVKIELKAES